MEFLVKKSWKSMINLFLVLYELSLFIVDLIDQFVSTKSTVKPNFHPIQMVLKCKLSTALKKVEKSNHNAKIFDQVDCEEDPIET